MGENYISLVQELKLIYWNIFTKHLGVNHLQPWIPRQDTVGEDMNTFHRTIGSMKFPGDS